MEQIEATIKSSMYCEVLQNGEVAHLLEGRHGRKLRRSLRAEGMDRQLDTWIDPRLSFRIEKIISTEHQSVSLEGGITLKSAMLARTMRDCTEAICFIATIGPSIDEAVKQANSQHRLSDAYLIDRIGSAAIEDVVDAFQHMMHAGRRMRDEGVTLRFSPGYCDWALTEQKKLFNLVATERIGVSLSSSYLMTPRKTVSGLFGILPPGCVPYNPCKYCKRTNCKARRLQPRVL